MAYLSGGDQRRAPRWGGMTEPKPIGIRATLWLAMSLMVASTMLGASALHTYDLHHRIQADEVLRARTLAESYAAASAGWLLRSREELSGQLQSQTWHPDVCLLAVVTSTRPGRTGGPAPQETLALRGDHRLLERFLRETQATGEPVVRLPVGRSPDGRHGWPDLYLVSVPIRASGSSEALATLICGVRGTTRSALTPREMTVFFLRLGLIAVTGGFMGVWWLTRSVVHPLAVLAQESERGADGRPLTQTACERDDEIGALARTLAEMHLSVDEWRERAARLERHMNQRVTSETQRVSHELQQAKRAVWTDPLTQLGNRQLLEDRFGHLYAEQHASGSELCVIMLDVDNFKNLNDTKGHAAGDELLRFMGELLRQSVREGDLAVRFGGDEFILILPSVPLADAQKIAQRIVLLFNQQARLLSIEPRLSLSAGVASMWEHKPRSSGQLLQLADQALYDAKRAGKARVQTAEAGRLSHQPIRRSLQLAQTARA